MKNLLFLSKLLSLFIYSLSVSCDFIPPSDQVCLGGSITSKCVLTGSFTGVQVFVIDSESFSFVQINYLDTHNGIDLTRLSATIDNTQDSAFVFTTLRANITLVNITKEDNGTVIGCRGLDSVTGVVDESDTLILASPPSQPDILLTPIPSDCSVRVHWSYPVLSSLPLTEQITDSVSNDTVTTQDQNFVSDSLTAGEDIIYTLSASNCLGDSATAVTQMYSPPSQPEAYSCVADYGTDNTLLVLKISNYTSEYAIETSFVITDDTDNVAMYSGNFSVQNPFYFSNDMIELNSSREFTVHLTSLLRDCIGSMSTSCQVNLSITAVVTTTAPTTPTTAGTNISTPTAKPKFTLPTFVTYLIIAFVLLIVLLSLSCVIILLVCLLGRGKLPRYRQVPKGAGRLPNQNSTSDSNPDLDRNKEELHYVTPDFPTNSVKPSPALPKTHYSDIREFPAATEAVSSL